MQAPSDVKTKSLSLAKPLSFLLPKKLLLAFVFKTRPLSSDLNVYIKLWVYLLVPALLTAPYFSLQRNILDRNDFILVRAEKLMGENLRVVSANFSTLG